MNLPRDTYWIDLATAGGEMAATAVAELEKALEATPRDIELRVRYLGYQALQGSRVGAEILFVVILRPDIELGAFGRLPGDRSNEWYDLISQAWDRHIDAAPDDPDLLFRAATFFLVGRPLRAQRLLRHGAHVAPDAYDWNATLMSLGDLPLEAEIDPGRGKRPEDRTGEPLLSAVRSGDPQGVADLIAAGADVHYRRKGGYGVFLNAVQRGGVLTDPRLLDLLGVLIAGGADPRVCSDYDETALRVLARIGRFDAIKFLLDAGADIGEIAWTPLMCAVAFGSVDDMQAALDAGADLEARDFWLRTAWLVALTGGDVAKAEWLRGKGADVDAVGRCGAPPLFHAIRGRHPDCVRWLLQQGADPRRTDEFASTPLREAVGLDDFASVDLLLAAGVAVNEDERLLAEAYSPAMVRRLLAAGADPGELSDHQQRLLLALPNDDDALATVSMADFERAPTKVAGRSNPERMDFAFWKAMVRSGRGAWHPRERYRRTAVSLGDPLWCADRFGQSLTFLPDGRAIQIGGEHEDFYDPDFCIYNDVIVHAGDGTFAIYGYPADVFPPTDFHTATLVGDFIYVIGSLGYPEGRRFGETPVFRLDTRTLRMEPVPTHGLCPGWIHGHRAEAVGEEAIRISGGEVLVDGDPEPPALAGSYLLDLATGGWRREP